ncbi:MAG: B12-binding domain-containing radical SAM protein [Myxococcales bacterium]|nr:B12-binding domain-containing radical SAM protein [Myxococcales bacterium]
MKTEQVAAPSAFSLAEYDSSHFRSETNKHIRVGLVQPLIPDGNYLPNLGIMYLAARLLQEGFSVEIFDENIHGEISAKVRAYKPHILGFTCVTAAAPAAARLAERLRVDLPDCRFVIGGPHVSSVPTETLEKFPVFEFGFVGECELSFPAFCRDLYDGTVDLPKVSGLVWNDGDEVRRNLSSRFMSEEDLQRVPFPAWHLIPVEQVFSGATHGLFSRGKRIMPIMTTRGCPNYCGFCARVMGFELRRRSIDLVLREIQWLYDTYNIDEIYFEDDTFTQDMERAEELLQGIIDLRLPIHVKFANGLRADKVNRRLLTLMKQAGVYWVGFGIESGSPRTQEAMYKYLDLDLAKRNVQLAKDLGFRVGSNCIIGYPGETKEDIAESIEYFLELKLDSMAIVSCVPFPGTTAWQICKANGWFTELADDYSNYWFEIFKVSPLIETPMLTARDLSRAITMAYVRFYILNPPRLARIGRMFIKGKVNAFNRSVRLLRANLMSAAGHNEARS